LTLIQSVLMSVENDELTHDDFSYSAPLLLYSSSIVPDFYIDSDSDNGRKSFELFRKSYNGVNSHKNLDTNVIVSYSNENKRYNILKDNLPRTVLSVVRRLKIGSIKIPHIIALDIEWNYLGKTISNVTNSKNVSQVDFDSQLDDIEEKHAIKRTASRKRVRINPLTAFFSKAPEDVRILNNKFLDTASQVKNENPITQVSNNDKPDSIDQD
ncbi:24886_t:CDS:1, partial [Racocetra persica]